MVCRMAGFNSAVRGISQSDLFFGLGVGDVLLDNVQCTGDESIFFDCQYGCWGVSGPQCSNHQNDAAAVCSDGERGRGGGEGGGGGSA